MLPLPGGGPHAWPLVNARLYSNNSVFYEALAWELKDVGSPSSRIFIRRDLQVERLLKEELQDFRNVLS